MLLIMKRGRKFIMVTRLNLFIYTNYDGSHAYIDIDISTWPISYRTVHSMDSVMDIFTWKT